MLLVNMILYVLSSPTFVGMFNNQNIGDHVTPMVLYGNNLVSLLGSVPKFIYKYVLDRE